MFSKETYIARRAKLKQAVGSGLLLFIGNDECGMNYADNTYHFRQDSTFLYFFGLPYAGLSAIIDIDNDCEIIFGDELTIDAIVWMGTQPTLKEKSEATGLNDVRPFNSIVDYLKNAQQAGQTIHYLPWELPTCVIIRAQKKLLKSTRLVLLQQTCTWQLCVQFVRDFVKATWQQLWLKQHSNITTNFLSLSSLR